MQIAFAPVEQVLSEAETLDYEFKGLGPGWERVDEKTARNVGSGMVIDLKDYMRKRAQGVIEEGGQLKAVEIPGNVVMAAGGDLNAVGKALGEVLNLGERAGKFGAVGLIAGVAGVGLLIYLAGRK